MCTNTTVYIEVCTFTALYVTVLKEEEIPKNQEKMKQLAILPVVLG